MEKSVSCGPESMNKIEMRYRNLFFLLLGLSIVLFSCKGNSPKERKGAMEGSPTAELYPDSLLRSAETSNQEGRKLAEKGFYEDATEWFDRAITADSLFHRAYYNRGMCRWYRGRYQDAIADYDVAIRLNPFESDYYNNRSAARLYAGDYKGALADAEKALHLGPEKVSFYLNHALANEGLKNTEAAIAGYRRIIVLDPHHIKAYYRMGCLLTNQGKTEESVDCYVQALKMADTTALPEVTAAIYYNLGRLYSLHGDKVKAKQIAQEGVSRYPESKLLKELLQVVQGDGDFGLF